MRQDLRDKQLTVADLQAMPEKQLADRYAVSRDTARKARTDVLRSVFGNSISSFDK
jgi:DNA-binding GntR family transcriptional regulator